MNKLYSIIKDSLKEKISENELIYNFLEESQSSKFYNELFDNNRIDEKLPDLYIKVKSEYNKEGSSIRIMEEVIDFLHKALHADAIVVELGGGIFQERSANAYKKFKYYYPLDISLSSITRYTKKFNKRGIVCDATNLPFEDQSVDCIYSHTFLEHPLNPERVLSEISRVIKPGGIVVHNDAWFCRWWQRFGFIGLKSPQKFTTQEKLIYLGYRFSEIKIFRLPPIILRRLFRHFKLNSNNPLKLEYKKLKPNYSLHLGCDEDAASSLDPIDVIRFYESRCFKTFKNLSFKERILYPNKYIVLVKSSSV